MLLTSQHICGSIGIAQKETLANSSKPLTLVRSCCVESNFCSLRFAEYLSTGEPVYGSPRASANSERCKMTGNEDNVGFLATGSGVKEFQLSSRGSFVRGARSSLASGAYPLSGSASAPAGLRNSQPPNKPAHPGHAPPPAPARRRRRISLHRPGQRRHETQIRPVPGSPVESVKRKTVNLLPFGHNWNCTHIHNIAISRQIERLCAQAGWPCPAICTPFDLLEA
jgi:hypothetical protein